MRGHRPHCARAMRAARVLVESVGESESSAISRGGSSAAVAGATTDGGHAGVAGGGQESVEEGAIIWVHTEEALVVREDAAGVDGQTVGLVSFCSDHGSHCVP